MNQFSDILILQVLLALIVAVALCVAVWRLAKAGGSVEVSGRVKVCWGGMARPPSAPTERRAVAASGVSRHSLPATADGRGGGDQ
jgi:hypothetical protein